jgi:aspartyl-tRNA(Asn)/glutamyl-tRNA(Gln) amidotransferase subunit A
MEATSISSPPGVPEAAALSATEVRARFLARELSPVELVKALLGRIEEVDGVLGAFTIVTAERALAEAGAAEARYARGEPAGPLDGIPVAVKDLFDTEGVPTGYGSPMYEGRVPTDDAGAVARLRAAGGIVLGKTATDEFAFGITSNNPHYGPVQNPWDFDRVSGGSSGGSAAALASFQVPLALGSDTGGSIRVPAAFCGVVGLKPTWGRVSTEGMFAMGRSIDHAGPLARTPSDAALLLRAILEPTQELVRVDGALDGLDDGLSGLRVVVCRDLHLPDLEPDIASVFERALATIADAGAELVETSLPLADTIFPTFLAIQRVETLATHRRLGLFPARRAEYGVDVAARLDAAGATRLDDYLDALAHRERLRGAFARLFDDGDVLVTPLHATPPPRLDTPALEDVARDCAMPFTVPANLLGLPACAVRAGFGNAALPVGIQFVARPWEDAAVLRASHAFAEATPDVQTQWPRLQRWTRR